MSYDRQRDLPFGGAGNGACRLPRLERDTLDLTPDNDVEDIVDNTGRAPARRGVLRSGSNGATPEKTPRSCLSTSFGISCAWQSVSKEPDAMTFAGANRW